MLDLDLINNKPIEIKINGKKINVNQPIFILAKRVRNFEKQLTTTTDEEEIYKEQTCILLEFLNNNSSNKKFTSDDIEKLSFGAIRALYNELVSSIVNISNDPN
ncbi:hypothetical protein FDC51_17820 [Clostridium botulinum]|nr:hypothetical protein [Clostridium botulinum]